MTVKNKQTIAVVTATMFVLFAVLGVFIWSKLNEPAPVTPPVATPTSTPTATSAPARSELPLMKAFPKAPAAKEGLVTVAVKGDTLTSSEGSTLTVKGAKLTRLPDACAARQVTDFCLASRISGRTVVDIYYLKDAVRSRLFENPKSFKAIRVPGSPSAGTLMLNMGSADVPTAVVVNKDSSGWMMVVTGEDRESVLASLIGTMSVK